jgi:hypothetical protein
MKARPEQLEKLAGQILATYKAQGLVTLKKSEGEIKSKIQAVISQNFAEEDAIEEEARKMLVSHARAAKDLDPYKMFLIAKQKLAAKKGFIL